MTSGVLHQDCHSRTQNFFIYKKADSKKCSTWQTTFLYTNCWILSKKHKRRLNFLEHKTN
jgi:hypothetical protein